GREGGWRGGVAVQKGSKRANPGHRLDEDFLPFAVKFGGQKGDACGIPTRLAEGVHKSLANHIVGQSQNWNACRRLLCGANCCISSRQDHVHASFHQLGRMYRKALSGHAKTSRIDHEVLAVDEAEPLQLVEQREEMRRIARTGEQAAEAINPSGFLCARDERPAGRRAAEQRDELAALHHSITLSARASSVAGTSMPSARAVTRLITK